MNAQLPDTATKSSHVSRRPGRTRDFCDDNEQEGEIPYDEPFNSGDDAPPFHPNCQCRLQVQLT
jgi:hypothetical protein